MPSRSTPPPAISAFAASSEKEVTMRMHLRGNHAIFGRTASVSVSNDSEQSGDLPIAEAEGRRYRRPLAALLALVGIGAVSAPGLAAARPLPNILFIVMD